MLKPNLLCKMPKSTLLRNHYGKTDWASLHIPAHQCSIASPENFLINKTKAKHGSLTSLEFYSIEVLLHRTNQIRRNCYRNHWWMDFIQRWLVCLAFLSRWFIGWLLPSGILEQSILSLGNILFVKAVMMDTWQTV